MPPEEAESEPNDDKIDEQLVEDFLNDIDDDLLKSLMNLDDLEDIYEPKVSPE